MSLKYIGKNVNITTLNFDWCVVKLNCWLKIFRWQIEFKTITQNSIILYNPGGGRGSDFLAVEILEGVIRVKMARGQIVHTVRVNDGQWHKMHLLFNPSLIEVNYLWWKKKFFTYRYVVSFCRKKSLLRHLKFPPLNIERTKFNLHMFIIYV